jgi:hypothetical protein
MLLHGTLSLTAAPARRVAQNQLAENDFLCFWTETLPYIFGAQLQGLAESPLLVGLITSAVLAVSVEAGALLQPSECLAVGSALQEQIGYFRVHALAQEPARDLPRQGQPVAVMARGPLTPTEQQLVCCIEHWVQQADSLCKALRHAYLLDFTRVGRLERHARMGGKGTVNGIRYAFHGIGCYFETPDLQLDVDFDSQGDWHGFDLWRMQTFIDSNYPHLRLSSEMIEQGIVALREKQWLYQSDRLYDHAFYYVTPVK